MIKGITRLTSKNQCTARAHVAGSNTPYMDSAIPAAKGFPNKSTGIEQLYAFIRPKNSSAIFYILGLVAQSVEQRIENVG